MTRGTHEATGGFDDNLEADLASALDGGEPPEPQGAPDPQARTGEPEDPFPRTGERARDEHGRFAPREQPAAGAPDPAAQPPMHSWQPLWLKDEHGVEWEKLPEPFRQMLQQRETEAAQAITHHAGRAKEWEPVAQTMAPYVENLKESGFTPQEYVTNLLKLDDQFRTDPAGTLLHLAQTFQIDINSLAEKAATAQASGQAQPDPRLMQELQAVRREVAALKNGRTDEDRQHQHQQITEWAKDKPYFSDVRPHMAALAKVMPGATLDQLYESALNAHPQLRARIQQDQRKAEAQRARQASVSTRGVPSGSRPREARLSLEEEIGALWDEATGTA